ncbi:MAG: PAS domain S-box protein [Thiobacillus sp.]|nr:PAS domain S-box protein [Thiobacillus sp.]
MSETVNDSTLADHAGKGEGITELRRQETLLKTGALQNAILNSANFSSIATDEKGVIQIFNVGAERMLGYAAADVLNQITPADISDPQEVIARAQALSAELGTQIEPGFEALVFKASRGIEDIYELTYIRKDGSRFPAIVSVTALRDDHGVILGYLLIGTDNTARKQAEEALLKAGALQSAIFNSANFSSIATDAKGVIQIFNVGAERMLGYTAAEVMNKITPADISDPKEVVARAQTLSVELETLITPGFEALVFKASRGIEDIYELTYIRKDGSRFPAVVSVTALRDDQNAIIGYLLIGTDNTARKQVEAERQHLLEVQEETNKQLQQTNVTLQVSEEKLAVTLHSIGDGVIATDAEARVTLLNPLAEKLTGWTQAQASGRLVDEVFNIINKETRLAAAIPVMDTLAHGTIQGLANHTVLIARDGSECDIADSCAPIRDRDGVVIGAVLVFRDVTGEYAAQQALRDQQFYTRSLIESNIDALMTTDSSGIITDVNQQMGALTGCTRDELIGTPFKNYFTDPVRAEAGIKRVLKENKITDYELTARHKHDGETVVSYNAATFYNADGELQGVFAAARDVTERKRLDQALQDKNTELESARFVAVKANLAKSDFLSSMSHELRTPLNAILGFAQLLEAGSPQPTAAQLVRLHQIIKAGWYLLDLINEILDLAVIESGQLSLSRESVSLIDVMRECQAMIEPQAEQRGIHIDFLPFDHTWFANADRTRVKQVLINLLSNAIKYNRKLGTVKVACTESLPNRLRISVKDSGEGLSEEKLAQLFQPFNRLGQETGGEEGTGIGLVVTKRLVELMGGTIGVESTVGKGSEFWIELVVDAAPQLATGSIMPVDLGLGLRADGNHVLRTLLYVEDNPANLMLVEQIIETHTHVRMLSARDGNLGVQLARTHIPDVVLMDINLPGMSGIEALKVLRNDPATGHIPVIALSANAMPSDVAKGLAAGFFRYLTKPIKIDEFMKALDSALEHEETTPARANRSRLRDD